MTSFTVYLPNKTTQTSKGRIGESYWICLHAVLRAYCTLIGCNTIVVFSTIQANRELKQYTSCTAKY